MAIEFTVQQWYNDQSSRNLVSIILHFGLLSRFTSLYSYHDEDKRRRTEEQREIDEVKQQVYNLPDNLTRGENHWSRVRIEGNDRGWPI